MLLIQLKGRTITCGLFLSVHATNASVLAAGGSPASASPKFVEPPGGGFRQGDQGGRGTPLGATRLARKKPRLVAGSFLVERLFLDRVEMLIRP